MSSGEMVQINTPRLESTLTNPSDCRFTSRQHALPWISPAHSMEVKSFSQGEAESIFRRYLDDETVEKHRDALLEFAKHVERLPIAIVVGADMLTARARSRARGGPRVSARNASLAASRP